MKIGKSKIPKNKVNKNKNKHISKLIKRKNKQIDE